jgi:hypothetical protein
MKKAPPATPPLNFDQSRIIWPVSLAGVLEAWQSVITPIQSALRSIRVSHKSVAVSYMSTAGGIAESKIKKINESELLAPIEDEQDERDTTPRINPAVLLTARAILEAASNSHVARMCQGHPNRQGIVCFSCHAPSRWPGSPERLADDVKEGQLKEWATSALECIVLLLDAVALAEPKNMASWAQSAAIATDKLLEGTKRHVAVRAYERHIRHQFMRLAYAVRNDQPSDVAARLLAGGMRKSALLKSVSTIAMAIDAKSFMSTREIVEGSMAAISYVISPPRVKVA